MSKRKTHILISATLIFLVTIITVTNIICAMRCLITNTLIEAIRVENVAVVEYLLEKGVDPNRTDVPPSNLWSFWETHAQRPLEVACKTRNLEIIKLLIDHGATAEPIMHTVSPLRKVLDYYYKPDDIEIVKLLLENGAVANDPKYDAHMAFYAAQKSPRVYDETMQNGTVFSSGYDEETARGITEIVCILLDGQSVNITTNSGETLLMVSAKAGNVYLTEYLLSNGADANMTTDYGKTALDFAKEAGNEEIISMLEQE